MKLIHYGYKRFDIKKFKPIKNINFIKPDGGFWTSPVNSKWGWKDWNEFFDFRKCVKSNSFIIELKENSKIFKIDSLEDLKKAPLYKSNSYYNQVLDFEYIAKNYDAIWLTEKGQAETHMSEPIDLYGWDCETVLILNPNCII